MPWNRTGTGDCCLFLICNINIIIISEQRKLNQINSSHLQQNVHLGQRHPHLHRVQLESAARKNVYRSPLSVIDEGGDNSVIGYLLLIIILFQ